MEIEATAARELRRFGENLSDAARSALRTIEADTAAWTGLLRTLLLRAWLRPLVVGLSLLLGICGESLATMRWLSTTIQRRVETVAVLNVDIEQARRACEIERLAKNTPRHARH